MCLALALASLCSDLPGMPAGLAVASPVRELGRVKPGVQVEQVFLATNRGPAMVNILDLRPECGCLTARASRTRLATGESAEIRVTFDPPPQEGPVTKGLELVTDGPEGTPLRLVLTAEVLADIGLSANQVAFQDLPRNGGGVAEVRLESRTDRDLRVTGVQSSAPAYLTAEPARQGRDVILRLRLDGSRIPAGLNQGEDWIVVQTAHPEPSEFRIQVRWTARPVKAGTP